MPKKSKSEYCADSDAPVLEKVATVVIAATEDAYRAARKAKRVLAALAKDVLDGD